MRLAAPPPPGALAGDFAQVRADYGVTPEFPAEVEAAAREAAAAPPPARGDDLRALPFFTVDPPGSRDLDQAMHLERRGDGYRVRYAIADVGALVARGGPVEAEAWRRGVTVYTPDVRCPLYPTVLSEGAASLLPGEDRAAIVFTVDLDRNGEQTAATVAPALVRSHERLDYAGLSGESAALLTAIGEARERLETARGAVRLDAPKEVVVPDPGSACGYRLEWERRLPSEDMNAQISLLAGMAAARIMLDHGVGLLRTMAGADAYRVEALRHAAAGLGVPWHAAMPYDDFVRSLDGGEPRQAALLEQARGVMGRAGYTAFAGTPPAEPDHAALAAAYAHTTAPLRRLADRYVLDLLVELGAGVAPADAERDALARLPAVMEAAEARAAQVERAVVDAAEARLLEARLGEEFAAVVVERDARGARLQIADPPVRARLRNDGGAQAGQTLRVRLVGADPRARSLQFALARPANA
jgi:exoribonuclease R